MVTIRISKIVQIVIFSVVIVIPLLFINFASYNISTIENRNIFPAPNILKANSGINKNFFKDFDLFFQDRIILRKQIIEMKFVLLNNFFEDTILLQFLRGKNGHLFYSGLDQSILYKYIDIYQYSNNLIDEEAFYLYSIFEYITNKGVNILGKGINVLGIFLPDKDSIYPELYPDTIIKSAKIPPLQTIALSAHDKYNVNTFNLTNYLLSKKRDNDMLYYKSYDVWHWNMFGALIGFNFINEFIDNNFFNINLPNYDDIHIGISNVLFLKNSNQFLDKSINYRDIFYDIKLYKTANYIAIDLDKIPVYFDNMKLDSFRDNCYYFINNSARNNYKILLIGDSYIYEFLLPLFAQLYNQVLFIHINPNYASDIPIILDIYFPDLIIIEQVERTYTPYYYKTFYDNMIN
ncbi:MAG: hypothetical protein LBO66_04800 [Deltaproteobacteria bacterium]|jgi:hypothetical protein|nr:hypothetical protein [Deltaproteobacteria bacterium]